MLKYIILVVFSALFIFKNAIADYFFVVQNKEIFHSDVSKTFSNDKHTYILLSNEIFKFQIDSKFRKVFKEIVFFKEINVCTLSNFLKDYLPSIKGTVHIVTHDECSLEIVAEVREKLNIKGDGVMAVMPFRNKLILRQKLSEQNLLQPRYYLLQQKPLNGKELSFPFFIKPVGGARCRSIYEIKTKEDLVKEDYEINLEQIHYKIQIEKPRRVKIGKQRKTSFWLWYTKPKGNYDKARLRDMRQHQETCKIYYTEDYSFCGPQFL